MSENNKFVITPKNEKPATLTIRIDKTLHHQLETLVIKSNRSRNELINRALKFAFNNLDFIGNNNDE